MAWRTNFPGILVPQKFEFSNNVNLPQENGYNIVKFVTLLSHKLFITSVIHSESNPHTLLYTELFTDIDPRD